MIKYHIFQTIYLALATIFSYQTECSQELSSSHYLSGDQGHGYTPEVDYHTSQHSLGSHGDYQNPLETHDEYHGEHHQIPSYEGPIAVPYVLANGHIADTHDVAEAKSHHLQAVAEAKTTKYHSGHQEYGYGGAYGYSSSHHGYGIPVVLPNGHIADTLEVAAEKASHLLAMHKVKSDKYSEGDSHVESHEHSGSYHGYGIPVVLSNGHIADTLEVAAAKAAHLLTVHKVKSDKYSGGDSHVESHEHSGSYHGYGIPVVLSNGHIADTHEVAAAKSAHKAAVASTSLNAYSHQNHKQLEGHQHSVPQYHIPHHPIAHVQHSSPLFVPHYSH